MRLDPRTITILHLNIVGNIKRAFLNWWDTKLFDLINISRIKIKKGFGHYLNMGTICSFDGFCEKLQQKKKLNVHICRYVNIRGLRDHDLILILV